MVDSSCEQRFQFTPAGITQAPPSWQGETRFSSPVLTYRGWAEYGLRMVLSGLSAATPACRQSLYSLPLLAETGETMLPFNGQHPDFGIAMAAHSRGASWQDPQSRELVQAGAALMALAGGVDALRSTPKVTGDESQDRGAWHTRELRHVHKDGRSYPVGFEFDIARSLWPYTARILGTRGLVTRFSISHPTLYDLALKAQVLDSRNGDGFFNATLDLLPVKDQPGQRVLRTTYRYIKRRSTSVEPNLPEKNRALVAIGRLAAVMHELAPRGTL